MELSIRLSKMYPLVDEKFSPIPRCWTVKDEKNKDLKLSGLNLIVKYCRTKTKDARSATTSCCIPLLCGIFYFEIKIITRGESGNVAIGISTKESRTYKMPGFERTSYGYHGENGNKYHSSDIGEPYGPTFTTGDIIGCGIDLTNKTCFFTKNGIYLGIAFSEIPLYLYPTVGLNLKGETVIGNFGQEKFKFDIENVADEMKIKMRSLIEKTSMKNKIYELQEEILTYLFHHGYIETASAFAKYTGLKITASLESVRKRVSVMQLLRQGEISSAIKLTNKLYPKLLEIRKDILFKLLCRQFIEFFNKPIIFDTEYYKELEENQFLIEKDFLQPKNCSSLQQIFNLGKEIYELNTKLKDTSFAETCHKKMMEAFSLLAYKNPQKSNLKWLLANSERESIIYQLNIAILMYLNEPPFSRLEIIVDLAKGILEFTRQRCNLAAVFVNIDDFVKMKMSE